MILSRQTPFVTALTLGLAATPALADLTVDDAWNTWHAQLTAMGLTVEADQTRDGDALQIGLVTLSADFPMDQGSGMVSFAGPRFESLGDGTVRMTLPDESRVSFAAEIKGEGSMAFVLDSRSQNNMAIMSGTPDRVVSDGSFDETSATLVSVTVDGEALQNVSGTLKMVDYAYQNITTFGDNITIEASAKNGGYDMAYSVEVADGDSVTTIAATGYSKDLKVAQTLVLPAAGIEIMALHNHLRAGLALSGSATMGSYGTFQETRIDGQILTKQGSEVTNYVQSMVVDENGIAVEGTASVFTSSMEVDGLPFPIKISGSSAGGHFKMPLLQADDPQNASFKMELQGMTLNDEIWAMADPEGQLPHDPMALKVDMNGQLSITADLVNFAMLAGLDDPSGLIEPVSADLNSLLLSAVGTELTGSGSLTFDASDTETYPGIPRPEGALDFELTGANALLDTLVAMGLVPEDQAMGARMMMGLFGDPVEGQDAFTSKIELNAEGQVLANGQRLR